MIETFSMCTLIVRSLPWPVPRLFWIENLRKSNVSTSIVHVVFASFNFQLHMLRRALGWSIATLSGWQCHVAVIKYRTSVEAKDRMKRNGGYLFRPGSTSDLMMDSLDVGDVLLFDRSCYAMRPWDAVESLILKYRSKCKFDHIAVILYDNEKQIPVVAELDRRGSVELTPYDRRVLLSQSNIVAVRRLRDQSIRTKKTAACADKMIGSLRSQDETLYSAGWFRRLINIFCEEEADPAALFVTDILRALQITSESDQMNISRIAHFAPADDDEDETGNFLTVEKKCWDSYYDPPLYVQLF